MSILMFTAEETCLTKISRNVQFDHVISIVFLNTISVNAYVILYGNLYYDIMDVTVTSIK